MVNGCSVIFLASRKELLSRLLLAAVIHSLLPKRRPMQKLLVRFVTEDTGATAIEYALIVAGIATAIIVAVQGIGPTLNGIFSNVNSQLR
jgi:pilus assembly protein Flp/PilA